MDMLSIPVGKHFHEDEDEGRENDDGDDSPRGGVYRPAVHEESSVAHLFLSRLEDQTVNLFRDHIVHTHLGDEQVPPRRPLCGEDHYR